MRLDRDLQRRILLQLRDTYPGPFNFPLDSYPSTPGVEGNLRYLEEHGLIQRSRNSYSGPPGTSYRSDLHLITAQGLDFLEDDGGVSAILKTVTMKFDADNIRNLIEGRIMSLEIGQEEKDSLRSKVRSLSADGLKHLMVKFMDKGIENAGNIVQWMKDFGS